jgi:hypothetical protein
MEVDGLIGGVGSDAGLSAVVAAGPFCIADDLAYDPLHEMLQEMKANPPQMLVSSRALHVATSHARLAACAEVAVGGSALAWLKVVIVWCLYHLHTNGMELASTACLHASSTFQHACLIAAVLVSFLAVALQVLLGPFVDVEQPLIAGGMINVTFQQLFQTQVGT